MEIQNGISVLGLEGREVGARRRRRVATGGCGMCGRVRDWKTERDGRHGAAWMTAGVVYGLEAGGGRFGGRGVGKYLIHRCLCSRPL